MPPATMEEKTYIVCRAVRELKTTITHGTPKGVRNVGTLEDYKHATPNGVEIIFTN